MSAQRSAPSRSKSARSRPARPAPARPAPAEPRGSAAGTQPRNAAADSILARSAALTAAWGPTVARILLGLVLAWFGYHELVQPALWTGYVPVLSPQSALATVLVLAHGWVLLVLAVALVAGIMPRLAAAAAALLLTEVVISLTVTGGLSDLTLRDVGVLGLAVAIASGPPQRLLLR